MIVMLGMCINLNSFLLLLATCCNSWMALSCPSTFALQIKSPSGMTYKSYVRNIMLQPSQCGSVGIASQYTYCLRLETVRWYGERGYSADFFIGRGIAAYFAPNIGSFNCYSKNPITSRPLRR